jgi:hypothetical protein
VNPSPDGLDFKRWTEGIHRCIKVFCAKILAALLPVAVVRRDNALAEAMTIFVKLGQASKNFVTFQLQFFVSYLDLRAREKEKNEEVRQVGSRTKIAR